MRLEPSLGETPPVALLTGAVGAGKSTAAQAALALLRPMRLGGFITYSVPENGALSVYIDAPNGVRPHDEAHRLAIRHGAGRLEAFPGTLENTGCAILRETCSNADLLLMDELGVIESDAPLFCAAVLAALNGALPALVVVKPKPTPFLNAIRALQSRLYVVSPETRDELPAIVSEQLRRSFDGAGTNGMQF